MRAALKFAAKRDGRKLTTEDLENMTDEDAIDAYLKAHPEYDRSKIEPKFQFKVPGDPLVAFSGRVAGDIFYYNLFYINLNI